MTSRRIVTTGILYPCQAMFLGRRLPLTSAPENLCNLGTRMDQVDPSCPLIIIEGCGVLINHKITAAAYAVLHGLAEVVRRIEALAPIRYLTDNEIDTVTSVYGESYRRSAENDGIES